MDWVTKISYSNTHWAPLVFYHTSLTHRLSIMKRIFQVLFSTSSSWRIILTYVRTTALSVTVEHSTVTLLNSLWKCDTVVKLELETLHDDLCVICASNMEVNFFGISRNRTLCLPNWTAYNFQMSHSILFLLLFEF